MKNEQAKQLLEKYKKGICTEEELALLESWYLSSPIDTFELSAEDLRKHKQEIWEKLPVHAPIGGRKINLWSIVYRAAMVLMICTFAFAYYQNREEERKRTSLTAVIVPGETKATLTLGNGVQIPLNKSANGSLVSESGMHITKNEDGEIMYHPSDAASNGPVSFHLISVPIGGYYSIILEDGTKVWLNAASSLKFPNRFSKERVVYLTGEGYFEVTKKEGSSFKVVTDHQQVEVLGTHFNISAYKDNGSTFTSLLEGSIRINRGNSSRLIRPGQRAEVNSSPSISVVDYPVENEIAWTRNEFLFENEDLKSIMHKVARWYNIEVHYQPGLEILEYSGSISRNKNIQQVLKIMELTGTVKFKYEGRRVTVMP